MAVIGRKEGEETSRQAEGRVPPGQVLTEKWPVLHYGSVPSVDLKRWCFRIFGLVKAERALTWPQFLALPTITRTADFHCVTGWSRLENHWEGVATQELLKLVEVDPRAKFVMVHGMNNFTANLPLPEFLDDDAMFAYKHDGRDLTPEHGWPLRLIVPKLYAWKSAKWVTGIELIAEDRPSFWEGYGYHMHGDPWKEERYSGW
jgi:DMSO/TMAO reductase YedYZ molybdopterin-dependent catalytic subunit